MKPTMPSQRMLRMLFWEATVRCNLACAHCRRLESNEADIADLSTSQAEDLIDQLAELGRHQLQRGEDISSSQRGQDVRASGMGFQPMDHRQNADATKSHGQDTPAPPASGVPMPVLVFSGGEPLCRADLFPLIERARRHGIIPALATNGTLIDDEKARLIRAAGIERVSVSLDGATADVHDRMRQIPGAFDGAIAGIRRLHEHHVPFQINMTLTRQNAGQLETVYELARSLGAVAVHLFMLVPVGCGEVLAETDMLSPQRYEEILREICTLESRSQIQIKVTCGPHYERVKRQLGLAVGSVPTRASRSTGILPVSSMGVPPMKRSMGVLPMNRGMGILPMNRSMGVLPMNHRQDADATNSGTAFQAVEHRQDADATNSHGRDGRATHGPDAHATEAPHGVTPNAQRPSKGCLAGLGVLFVSHRGEVYPCGYLPVDCGHVLEKRLVEIWDGSEDLARMRDVVALEGKCGVCGYKQVCGGCRARAFAATGNYMGEEPFCAYVPRMVTGPTP